jgi:hypothetical protein
LDEWLDWKQRLESQKASGLSVSVYCLQEGVSLSRYFHWQRQLKNGIPVALLEEEADRRRAESEEVNETTFLPISLQTRLGMEHTFVTLPNGLPRNTSVRLSATLAKRPASLCDV